jgi:hypothetical protein
MPRESQATVLKRYRHKIKLSQQQRQEDGLDATWRRLVEMYRGKQYEWASPEDRMVINMAFSTVNVIAPSVAVNNPKIAVNATKTDSAPQAIITEAVVNYWWRHYGVKNEFRRSVKDFLICGHGWLKCGWRYVKEEEPDPLSDDDISDPEGDPSTPTVVVSKDCPFVERVSVHDVFVDPDATALSDAGWIAQRVRRPINEVKSDKRYSGAARRDVTATSWHKDVDEADQKKVYDTDAGYVEVWEFYDNRRKTISVFANGGEHFLVAPQPMPYAFGHPFVMMRNYDVPDFFYPMGDLEAIEPLQSELNQTRTQMFNHRKKFSRKYLYKANAFGPDGRKALESDQDNALVPVEAEEALNNVVVPFPTQITPPEFYNQSQMIQGDMETVSGVSEYMRGQMPDIRRTATEAGIIADASNARAADKLATIEAAISEVARRLVQLAQQFLDGEHVVRVVGEEGQPAWVKFDKEYIAGEFDYEVEGGSTAPNNESFRRQSALQLVDAMAPFMNVGVVNMPALAAHVLQFGFGIKTPTQFIQEAPPPPPDAAQGAPEAPPPGGAAGGAGMPPAPPNMDALFGA